MSARRDAEFTEYVHARLSWLRGLAYVLCQDWQRADDIVQAAVTRVYVRWDQASAADHLDGYVRAILVREFVKDQRSAWSRRVLLASQTPEVASRAQDYDAGLDLRGALAWLPPRQRATPWVRLLPHVKPGDSPSDDHALNLARSFKYREDCGRAGSFRR